MDSGLYAACAGLMARTQAVDTIASNLANGSSAGFRGQKNVFGTVLAQAAHHGRLSVLNKATNSYGVLSGTALDDAQGSLTHTGNQLDVALQGPGYFKVQTAHGTAYTRNGSFQVSTSGQLTTATGDAVLGDAGPLTVGTGGGAVAISPDGTLSSTGAIVGKLQIVAFPPSATLQPGQWLLHRPCERPGPTRRRHGGTAGLPRGFQREPHRWRRGTHHRTALG